MDDRLIVGSNQEEIQMFIRELKIRVQNYWWTTGEFPRNPYFTTKGSIFLTQQIYSKKILDKFGMSDNETNPVSTPSEGIIQKNNPEEVFDKKNSILSGCSLMYLTSATHPDLVYAVSAVLEKLD